MNNHTTSLFEVKHGGVILVFESTPLTDFSFNHGM
ncbi:hypothetical protein SAMN05421743_106101 [Thalassobacillus cyri]|uniref:Uncharacterized protein n=1 Tax=Thalassobacillus cyri TaxID=571932 RepID=A0A1H4CLM1_9BACI|nr:hypothetical protein SAMN05421743_106101 [Thalassobacillus cyri]